MSVKKAVRLNAVTLLIVFTCFSLFLAVPTSASVNENTGPKNLNYEDILCDLGFNSGDADADLNRLQKSLGFPMDGKTDKDTISLLESIGAASGDKNSDRQYHLQKTSSGYQLVIIKTIPVPEAHIGSLAQYAQPASVSFFAGAEEDPGTSYLETKMVEMINSERTARGLNPLEIDQRLINTARIKSQDMVKNNYFSHDSPTYGTPFALMKSQGIKYAWAGENLAGAPTLEIAFRNLMNSEGHRKNILHPNFSKVGVGIAEGSKYQMVFTQHFIGY